MLVVSCVEAAELEDEQPDVVPEGFTRFQEGPIEQLGVEEVLVRFPRLHSEAGQVGEPLQRDVVGHFETEEEIAGHLLNQTTQIFGGGKLVVGRIHADGFEHPGIFNETIPLEPALRKFPSEAVTLLIIQQPTHPSISRMTCR